MAAALFPPEASDPVSLPAPARHHDVIRHMGETGWTREQVFASVQGFLTDAGRFVTREEAWPIAATAGQILPLGDGIIRVAPPANGRLYSEDVW